MVKVHVDISVFTKEDAFGQIAGPLDIAVVPQVGDIVDFRLTESFQAYVGEQSLPFGGHLRVTDRIIGAHAEDGAMLMLQDVTAATREEPRQLLNMFEQRYGLLGNVWREEI